MVDPIQIEERHYADLIGTPFEYPGHDCWWLVREVYDRCGVELVNPDVALDYAMNWHEDSELMAEQAAALWERVPPGEERPGDMAAFSMHGRTLDHVGILLEGDRILQCKHPAVEAPRVAVMRRWMLGYWRPTGKGIALDRRAVGDVAGDAHGNACVVRLVTNILTPQDHERHIAAPGEPISSYVPDGWDADYTIATVNGGRADLATVARAGDSITIAQTPGIPATAFVAQGAAVGFGATAAAFAVNTIIAVGLSFIARALLAPPQPDLDSAPIDESPTFSQVGIKNSIRAGATIPTVIGKHRVGGQIIETFNTVGNTDWTIPPSYAAPGSPPGLGAPVDPLQFGWGVGSYVTPLNVTVTTGGKTTLNMLIALSEGAVQSVNGETVDGNDIPAQNLTTENLLINGNDAASYNDIAMSVRMGTAGQSSIPGFQQTVNAVGFEIGLKYQQPFTTTTTSDVDGFEIQLFEVNGHFRVSSGGGAVKGKRADYNFKFRQAGTTTWLEQSLIVRRYLHKGPHSWVIRRDGLTRGTYEIFIERLTEDDDDPTFVHAGEQSENSLAIVNAINEITLSDVAYPGVALVAIKALASDQLNGVPTVTSLVEGKKWWVWDGVDADNPDFTFEYTQNPSDILAGLLLNKNFGFGTHLDPDDIDWASFKTWKDYCDETVSDNRPTPANITRWQYNHVIDRPSKGADVIDQVLTSGRADLVPVGRRIGVKVGKATSPSHLFTEGNVGGLAISYLDTSERPSRISAQYANEELDYDFDFFPVEDDTVTPGEFIEETVSVIGITHPSRVARYAQFRLNIATTLKKRVEFTAPIDAVTLSPGDVFWVSHQEVRSTHIGGRLQTAASTSLTIDQPITLDASSVYKVTVKTTGTGASVLQERTINSLQPATYAAGDTISVSVAWDAGDTPVKGDVYAIGIENAYLESFECIECPMGEDLTRRVVGLEYDATIYTDDPGEVPTSTEVHFDPREFPAKVTNLHLTEETQTTPSGDVKHVVRAAWVTNFEFEETDVYTRHVDDSFGELWEYVGRGTRGSIAIQDVATGDEIEVSVVPRSPSGSSQHPSRGAKATISVRGKLFAPPDVTSLRIGELDTDIVLGWDEPTEKDISHFEVRAGAQWLGGIKLDNVPAKLCRSRLPILVPGGSSFDYLVKAVNSSGIPSEAAASVSYTHGLPDTSVATDQQDPGWAGTKTNMTVFVGVLNGDASQTSLSYETPELDAGSSDRYYLTTFPVITFQDRAAPTWATATWQWGSEGARVRTWVGGAYSDYPDSYSDAVRCRWGDADFTWDDPLAHGRTWSGLDNDNFFKVTLSRKTGTDSSAYSSASFDPFDAQIETFQKYGFKVEITVPHSDYLAKISAMNSTVYERQGRTLSGLSDTTITSPVDGHFLRHDGSGWVNQATVDPTGGLKLTASGIGIENYTADSSKGGISIDGSNKAYVPLSEGTAGGNVAGVQTPAQHDAVEGYRVDTTGGLNHAHGIEHIITGADGNNPVTVEDDGGGAVAAFSVKRSGLSAQQIADTDGKIYYEGDDLESTLGAGHVGILDAGTYTSETTVEGALQELYGKVIEDAYMFAYIPYQAHHHGDPGDGTFTNQTPADASDTDPDAVYAFANWGASADEKATVNCIVPDDLDVTQVVTLKLYFSFSSTPGASEQVQLAWDIRAVADGESMSTGGQLDSGTNDLRVDGYSSNELAVSSLGTVFAANELSFGDLIKGSVGRNGTAGGDTFGGTMRYIGCSFHGTKKKEF